VESLEPPAYKREGVSPLCIYYHSANLLFSAHLKSGFGLIWSEVIWLIHSSAYPEFNPTCSCHLPTLANTSRTTKHLNASLMHLRSFLSLSGLLLHPIRQIIIVFGHGERHNLRHAIHPRAALGAITNYDELKARQRYPP